MFGLPTSLVALLALTTSSSLSMPVDSDGESYSLLTAATFNSTIASGTWLIEFFSPYCGHCRHFAPTWRDLSDLVFDENEAGKGKTLGVKMGQVNCIVSGDICTEQNVTGYPTLRMYREGVSLEEFKGNRDLDPLVEFVVKHAPHQSSPTTTSSNAPSPTQPTPTSEPIMRVQTARSNKNVNPDGAVLELTPSNFHAAVEKDPVFIKFYAPWCGHCKKLAPVWVDLAERLRHKMVIAEVNCDAHGSLCSSQGVEGYPMLYFYRDGFKMDYTGRRSIDAMLEFTEKVMEPAVKTLGEKTPADLLRDHEVSFIFLHMAVDTSALDLVTRVGNTELANPPLHIYTANSPSLRSQFEQTAPGPAIFAIKRSGGRVQSVKDIKPTASFVLSSGTTEEDLRSFIDRNKLPLVSRLDSENFQAIMKAKFDPLVALLVTSPDDDGTTLSYIRGAEQEYRRIFGRTGRRDVVWAHLDGEKWSSWLKGMYGIKAKHLPAFVVADPSSLVYYNEYKGGGNFELSTSGMVEAVEQVTNGELKYKHSRNFFERLGAWISSYLEWFVNAFYTHPIRMLLFMIVFVCVLIFLISKIILADVGHTHPHHHGGPNGHGRLSLRGHHEKSRRLD